MIVAKFGGTSVSTPARIHTICEIVRREAKKDPVVVVSAMAGVTNLLLSLFEASPTEKKKLSNEIYKIHQTLIEGLFTQTHIQQELLAFIETQVKELGKLTGGKANKEKLDRIAGFGEIMSSYIIARALENSGMEARQVLSTDLIVTNDNFGSAEFLPAPTKANVKKKLLPLIKQHIVPVITGFIGKTKSGKTTTLGRGGSDYTASIVGFCLHASEIQIWTDVDGVYTADPRFVKTAKLIPSISFKEASELATFGARVLHPRTIKPAIAQGIPVRVLNTFNPKSSGTLIVEKAQAPHKASFTAIAFKRNVTLINLYSSEMLLEKGFLARVFEVFTKHNISIDLVSVSEVSISVTLDNTDGLAETLKELSDFTKTTRTDNLGMVSLIGEGMISSSHTIAQIFAIMDKEAILVRMISLGATNINISLIIRSEHIDQAVKALHDGLLRTSDQVAASLEGGNQ